MLQMKKIWAGAMLAIMVGAAEAAEANCDWRAGMVDLDLCPAVRASIEAEDESPLTTALARLERAESRDEISQAHTAIAQAKLGAGDCEDALGAVLDALWIDPLNPLAHQALDAVAGRCRADFLLRSALERSRVDE